MKKILMVAFLLCALAVLSSCAAPSRFSSRLKRVSDQRLAELETLLALAKYKNRKYVSLPVGFGLIDVQQIGRRKRSLTQPLDEFLLRQALSEPNLSDVADSTAAKWQLPTIQVPVELLEEWKAKLQRELDERQDQPTHLSQSGRGSQNLPLI